MNEKTNEQEAVRTTIVGGRPPGSGRSNVAVPRGIEVLLKKAAVDPAFCRTLIEQRDGAAAAIELQLAPAEIAMLKAMPEEQLKLIVSRTSIPVEQRRVFLGRVAAAMLATISAGLASCAKQESAGIRPQPPSTDGIRPDRPGTSPTNAPPTNPTVIYNTTPAGVRPGPP
jgi:hypothetical protein